MIITRTQNLLWALTCKDGRLLSGESPTLFVRTIIDACKFEAIVVIDPIVLRNNKWWNGGSSLEVQPRLCAEQQSVVAARVRQIHLECLRRAKQAC
jgi:hypothetical protein